MTNTEFLTKIKAEIENALHILGSGYSEMEMGQISAYGHILSFLSTLESEKPMNIEEELNEEIKKEIANLPFFIRGKDQIAFARHFAEWGRKQVLQEIYDGKVKPVDKITAAWLDDEQNT